MKKKAKARFNHGRWIADCPDCLGAENVSPGEKFICGNEFPNKHAHLYKKVKTKKGDRYIRGPDIAKRKRAAADAAAQGKRYSVVWPKDAEEIVQVLRMRPTENMNWEPGETLADLRRENEEHGIPEFRG
jgi:hypothetical protein